MRFLTILLIMVPIVSVCMAQAPAQGPNHPLTLREAIDMALARNPEVLLAQAQLDELDGKVKEVRSEAFPQVTFSGFGLRVRDPSFLNSSAFDDLPPEFRNALVPRPANLFDLGVGLSQPLYTAGKVRNAVRLAQEGRKEKEAGLETARQQVAFKVFQAYYDLLLAQENLTVLEETYRQRQKQLELAKARFSQGVSTEIDVLRSEVSLANTEPYLIRANNRIRLARAALNNLIVVDLENPTQLAGKLEYHPQTVEDLAQIQHAAMQARPEVQAAQRVVAENGLLLTLAKSENKLKVDLDTRFGYNVRQTVNLFNNNFARWNFTVNLKLPLYDGGRKAGLVVQAMARLRTAQQSLARLENNVQLEIKAAYDDLKSSEKALTVAGLNVGQAEKVLSMMQANYKYGAATTLDVVDSQTALTVARNAQVNATYDYVLARARLRLAAGSPILEGEVSQP